MSRDIDYYNETSASEFLDMSPITIRELFSNSKRKHELALAITRHYLTFSSPSYDDHLYINMDFEPYFLIAWKFNKNLERKKWIMYSPNNHGESL